MGWIRYLAMATTCAMGALGGGSALAQEIPSEYKTTLSTLGKTGDFKDGVRSPTRVAEESPCNV